MNQENWDRIGVKQDTGETRDRSGVNQDAGKLQDMRGTKQDAGELGQEWDEIACRGTWTGVGEPGHRRTGQLCFITVCRFD